MNHRDFNKSDIIRSITRLFRISQHYFEGITSSTYVRRKSLRMSRNQYSDIKHAPTLIPATTAVTLCIASLSCKLSRIDVSKVPLPNPMAFELDELGSCAVIEGVDPTRLFRLEWTRKDFVKAYATWSIALSFLHQLTL